MSWLPGKFKFVARLKIIFSCISSLSHTSCIIFLSGFTLFLEHTFIIYKCLCSSLTKLNKFANEQCVLQQPIHCNRISTELFSLALPKSNFSLCFFFFFKENSDTAKIWQLSQTKMKIVYLFISMKKMSKMNNPCKNN